MLPSNKVPIKHLVSMVMEDIVADFVPPHMEEGEKSTIFDEKSTIFDGKSTIFDGKSTIFDGKGDMNMLNSSLKEEVFKYYWLELEPICSGFGDEIALNSLNSKFNINLDWEELANILYDTTLITPDYNDIVYGSEVYLYLCY